MARQVNVEELRLIHKLRPAGCLLLLWTAFLLIAGLSVTLYNLLPISEVDGLVRYLHASKPPEETASVPQEQVALIVEQTMQALTPNPNISTTQPMPTPVPTETPLPSAISLPSPTASPSAAPTTALIPRPDAVSLSGVRNEVETRNNCGPATLGMALSFWGWMDDQSQIRHVLRPNLDVDDKNVMPAEMVNYVHNHTDLRAMVRVGGDYETLQRLIAAGFPVIIEKGHTTTGWIGHYILLTGYSDSQGVFLSQDSLIVSPDVPVPYSELEVWWRHFNYLYLIVYPGDREAEVLSVLGPHADATYNFQSATEKARQEIPHLSGRDLFFGWYNLGSGLTDLGDFTAAAQSFDVAFNEIYPTIKKKERPWRALWYRTNPYQAYFHTARYQDVINLADATILNAGTPVLEETFFWRGMAREAMGDQSGAISDYRKAARLNQNSTAASEQLQRLGEALP